MPCKQLERWTPSLGMLPCLIADIGDDDFALAAADLLELDGDACLRDKRLTAGQSHIEDERSIGHDLAIHVCFDDRLFALGAKRRAHFSSHAKVDIDRVNHVVLCG